MSFLILTNNPDRASFRQRIEAYIPLLEVAGIECEVAVLLDNIAAEMLLTGDSENLAQNLPSGAGFGAICAKFKGM
jgi:hypothetical protein